ncbi:hypothetical protein GCK72_022161 [Caenorhabditis remanei]|uniref:C2H2-type domain-containing protein n=1 Tax=Caenorhabditis remanei TaxID=31234 RepID=A0A6A5FT29_CAERE|nr:hypothetical protein GCK72_022161 [Caenorhabditis remanei]KAF1745714.1 hypothetical protein GCK72_022161 [Caenorhabditis remanei]
MEHSHPLIEYFMETMVDPVVTALRKQNCSCAKQTATTLKTKIEKFGGELIDEISRLQNTTEVLQTMNYLLDTVDEVTQKEAEAEETEDEDEAPAPLVSPPLTSDEPSVDGMSITEMILLNALCSPPDSEPERMNTPISINIEPSSVLSPSPPSSADTSIVKEMPSRKRAKRSLEDTVQMLSKENSMSPPPPTTVPHLPSLPFVLPQVSVPFSNSVMMQRWMGSPFTNPVYLNAMNMFQQQRQPTKSSEEHLAALMKMSMHAASFIQKVSPTRVPLQSSATDSDAEDVKVDVESDEGETVVSPSPSTADMTENESSSSSNSGPMTSPTSGDGDAAEKPFICMHNNCGKRFANKFLLKKHMFIHTGLRPHTCPHCHKKFNRKDNLLRHKKTHNPTDTPIVPHIPKNVFHGIPQLPNLHNLALPQSFSHFHALKMTMENGATAVRSLS